MVSLLPAPHRNAPRPSPQSTPASHFAETRTSIAMTICQRGERAEAAFPVHVVHDDEGHFEKRNRIGADSSRVKETHKSAQPAWA
jgi:hypothetical protein